MLQKLFTLVHRIVEINWGKQLPLWMNVICYHLKSVYRSTFIGLEEIDIQMD